MRILLDTCCIIWAVSEPETLSKAAAVILESEDTEVFVSPISAAEIACASERGRIVLNQHWRKWFRHYIGLNQWQLINIDLDVVEEAYSLPEQFHADPADRIIAATARLNDLTILTADQKILSYPHIKALW